MEKKKQKIRQISCGSFRPYFHWNVVVAFNSIWNYIGMYSFQLISINSHFGLNSFRQFRKSIVNRTTERGMNEKRTAATTNINRTRIECEFFSYSEVQYTLQQNKNQMLYTTAMGICYSNMLEINFIFNGTIFSAHLNCIRLFSVF